MSGSTQKLKQKIAKLKETLDVSTRAKAILAHDLFLARAEISALTAVARMGNGWLPIESAPRDGTPVLLLSKEYETETEFHGIIKHRAKCSIGRWDASGTSWCDEQGDYPNNSEIDEGTINLHMTGIWVSGGGWFQQNEVTHWQPLPAATRGRMVSMSEVDDKAIKDLLHAIAMNGVLRQSDRNPEIVAAALADHTERLFYEKQETVRRAEIAEAEVEKIKSGSAYEEACAERDAALACAERAEAERDDELARIDRYEKASVENDAGWRRELDVVLAEVAALKVVLKPFAKLADEIDDCCRETPEANNPYAWSKVCQYADLSVARAAFKQTPISESEIDAAEKSIKQGLAYDMPPRDLALKALTAVADLASTGPSIDLNRLRQDR